MEATEHDDKSLLHRLREYVGFRLLLLALWVIPRRYTKAIGFPEERAAASD